MLSKLRYGEIGLFVLQMSPDHPLASFRRAALKQRPGQDGKQADDPKQGTNGGKSQSLQPTQHPTGTTVWPGFTGHFAGIRVFRVGAPELTWEV